MAKVYIAGPMRGYPQYNFPAFDAAAALGRSLGWDVTSPADMDRNSGINEKSLDLDKLTNVERWALIREFVTRDVGALLSFRAEDGDAIALLPGWRNSTGAKAELAVAQWLGLVILDARTFKLFTVELVGFEIRPFSPLECKDGLCGSGIDMDAETYAMKTIAERIANSPTLNN